MRRKRQLIATYALAIACVLNSHAQTPTSNQPPAPQVVETDAADDLVTRAASAVCLEREQDPQGSAAIDELQARPSLPLLHADVLAGAARAERLLPMAKTPAANVLR